MVTWGWSHGAMRPHGIVTWDGALGMVTLDGHMGWSHGMVTWDGSHGILTLDGHMGCSHGMSTLEWNGHIGWSRGMVTYVYSIQICCRAEGKVSRILGRMAESNFPSGN